MNRIILIIFSLWFATASACAQDIRSQLRQVAGDLAKKIEAKGKKRVVIASFLNLKNQETELGRYMSDKFSIGLSDANSSLEITDRSQLAQLLLDNKLAAERILDPKTIPRLGNITGAEVIITANYTVLDNSIDITVKAIELERGLRLAVAEGNTPRTSEVNKLLSEIEQTTYSSNDGPGSPPNPGTKCAGHNTAGVLITVKECVLNGGQVVCDLEVLNDRADKADASFEYNQNLAYIITDKGRQYGLPYIGIANTGIRPGIANSGYTSIYGVKVTGRIVFAVDDSSIKSLQVFEMKDQGLRCTNIPVGKK